MNAPLPFDKVRNGLEQLRYLVTATEEFRQWEFRREVHRLVPARI